MKYVRSTYFSPLLFLLLFSTALNAQESKKPLAVTIGAIKTELKQNAIQYGIRYVNSLDSMWERQDFLFAGDHSSFLITPDIRILSGDADAFSSIQLKLTGLTLLFDTISIGGIVTPNTAKTFHSFPFSAGLETNNKFSSINGIAEVGWVPWYQTGERKIPAILKRTKVGIFIQGGYKFPVDSSWKTAVGGETDQSMEVNNHAIFRTKGSVGIDTKSLLQFAGVGLALVGTADGWFDLLNNQWYYSLQGKIRLYLTQNKDKYFDLQYQKGSGAPNFNQGTQYGVALTMDF
jgi:hypothetical protein